MLTTLAAGCRVARTRESPRLRRRQTGAPSRHVRSSRRCTALPFSGSVQQVKLIVEVDSLWIDGLYAAELRNLFEAIDDLALLLLLESLQLLLFLLVHGFDALLLALTCFLAPLVRPTQRAGNLACVTDDLI